MEMEINSYKDIKSFAKHIKLDKGDLNSINGSVTFTLETNDGGKCLVDVFFLSSGDIGDFLEELHIETKQIKKVLFFLKEDFCVDKLGKIADEVIKEREIYKEHTLGNFGFIEVEKDFEYDMSKKLLVMYSSKPLGVIEGRDFKLQDETFLIEIFSDIEKYPLSKQYISCFSKMEDLEITIENDKKTYSYCGEIVAIIENNNIEVDNDGLFCFIDDIIDNAEATKEYEDVSNFLSLLKN